MRVNQLKLGEVQALFRAKQRRRRELARLPIEEKIRMLVEMQKVANDIRAATGRPNRRVWRIPE
jgi:hypothetical protein